jgi:hypothetical protein
MKRLVSILLALTVCAALVAVVWANGGSETITVVSDTSVDVYGPLSSYAPVGDSAWGTTPNPAVATYVHPSWPWQPPQLDGKTWISTAYFVEEPVQNSSWRWFTKSVDLCPGAYNIAGTITATSDNAEDVYVNGNPFGSDGEVQDPWEDDHEWETVLDYTFTADPADTLTLDFIVRNYPGSSDPTANPTGLIFKAVITYDCPIQVQIDIKPGSDPNCFNSDGHGVIPVAILGSADFDASTVDPFSVSLDSAQVRVKGKSGNAGSLEDVNGDGFLDLVVQITDEGGYDTGDTMATLEGSTYNGTPIQGSDSICIRPPG